MKYLISLILVVTFCPVSAFCCPRVNGLLDANCDGKVQVAVFGDSIVRGIMDTGLSDETGGYLRFLGKTFSKVTFINGGIPGIDSRSLFRAFIKNAPKEGKTYQAIRDSDVVLIGVGINDYWLHVPAQMTVRNIIKTKDYVRKFGKREFGISPLTMTIAVTNTLRGFQEPWVKELNSLIYANAAALGPIVPFNKLAARLIVSDDALHPDDLGYKRLAGVMAGSLKSSYNKLAKSRMVDSDKDTVSDLAEVERYKTNPELADTDSDTLSDGAEIFTYGTNPLSADSDGDGVDDATEIALGTNAVPVVVPTATPIP